MMLPYHQVTQADRIIQSFDKFIGENISPRILANHIKKIAGQETVITIDRSSQVDRNDIILNAFYDPDEDETGGRPFEVCLIFNPEDTHVNMNKTDMREFAGKLIEYLEHEMIHRAQYQSRNFKANKMYRSLAEDPAVRQQQEYLGNTDEIEAYAANLARELHRKTGNYHQTLRLLRNFASTAVIRDQAGRLLSPNLYAYFKEFEFNTTHPVLKRLLKKTYQYVQHQKKTEERAQRVADRNQKIQSDTERFLDRTSNLDKNSGSSYTVIVDR